MELVLVVTYIQLSIFSFVFVVDAGVYTYFVIFELFLISAGEIS